MKALNPEINVDFAITEDAAHLLHDNLEKEIETLRALRDEAKSKGNVIECRLNVEAARKASVALINSMCYLRGEEQGSVKPEVLDYLDYEQ